MEPSGRQTTTISIFLKKFSQIRLSERSNSNDFESGWRKFEGINWSGLVTYLLFKTKALGKSCLLLPRISGLIWDLSKAAAGPVLSNLVDLKLLFHFLSCKMIRQQTLGIFMIPFWVLKIIAEPSSVFSFLVPSIFYLEHFVSSLQIIWIAILWIYSSFSESFLNCGAQNWTQYLRWVLTNAE